MKTRIAARPLALFTALIVVLTMALPTFSAAAIYQYGCCSTANGTILKTTDGWLVRTSNNRNTPPGNMYRLDGYYYNGTVGGVNYYALSSTSQTYSVSAGGYSARHDCWNTSGSFLVNVSCWTVQ